MLIDVRRADQRRRHVVPLIFCLGVLASSVRAEDSLATPIPDSPGFYAYSTNTYTELGWIEMEISEHRGISGWSIDYTWNTLDGFMGTFYAQSPTGTVFVIGFAEEAGTYNKATDDFNDEWADGTWIFWVEDVQGFGEQQAVGITWTLYFVDADLPFGLIAQTSGDSAQLTWRGAADEAGLLGYRVYRDDVPITDVPVSPTAYVDAGLELGTYCYHVTSLYDSGESGPSNQDCTTIYPPGTYGLPDSPNEWFRYNSYYDLGWTDVEVIDRGVIEGWSITFTWQNTNGFTDGSLHVESAAGTLLTVGSGFAGNTYTIPSSAFDNEPSHGQWRVWMEDDDTFGDGQYRVTDATMTLDVDRTVPTDLEAASEGAQVALTWTAPQESGGIVAYNLFRNDSGGIPIGSVDSGTTTYTDADISGGATYCYQVSADYGDGESLWPLDACAGAHGVFPIPDSPPPNQVNTYWYNSWTEAGWIEFEVTGMGPIAGWHITYTWATNMPAEGRFYALSPEGTQLTINPGLSSGTYTLDSDVLNGESANGVWRVWIEDEDFFYDGMHSASDIVMVIDEEGGPAIPTAGWWSVSAMALLLLAAGALVLARRLSASG